MRIRLYALKFIKFIRECQLEYHVDAYNFFKGRTTYYEFLPNTFAADETHYFPTEAILLSTKSRRDLHKKKVSKYARLVDTLQKEIRKHEQETEKIYR